MSNILSDNWTTLLFLSAGIVFSLFAFALVIKVESLYREKLISLVFPISIGGLSLSTLFSDRVASNHAFGASDLMDTTKISIICLQLSTLTIVFISLIIISNFLIRKGRFPTSCKSLYFGFIAYYVSNYIINAILGLYPSIEYHLLYPLIAFTASYLSSETSPDSLIDYAKNILSLFIIASFLTIFINSNLVIENGYQGLFGFFDFRFWGLSSHANNTGPLIVLYLLILILKPYEQRLLQYLAITVGIVAIFITQSKTAWVAAFASFLFLFLYNRWKLKSGAAQQQYLNLRLHIISLIVLMPTILITLFLFYFVQNSSNGALDFLSSANMNNFTGRDSIWQVSLNEWVKNPLFGYGPLLWGEEFSKSYGLFGVVSNAHNQLVQSLAASGLLGLLGTIIYITYLTHYSFRTIKVTNGVSVSILLVILFRCITEVPLGTKNLMTTDFMVTLLVFNILIRYNYLRICQENKPL